MVFSATPRLTRRCSDAADTYDTPIYKHMLPPRPSFAGTIPELNLIVEATYYDDSGRELLCVVIDYFIALLGFDFRGLSRSEVWSSDWPISRATHIIHAHPSHACN